MKTFTYKSTLLNCDFKISYSIKGIKSLIFLFGNMRVPISKIDHNPEMVTIVEDYLLRRKKLLSLKFDLEGTALQLKVWKKLQEIPFSQVISYSALAKKVGHPSAVRAVASAVAKNPIPILIPCHRVIRLSGERGKYSGGGDLKNKLLDFEVTDINLSK